MGEHRHHSVWTGERGTQSLLVLLFLLANLAVATAQIGRDGREEIPLQISIPGLGSTMVPALIDERGVLLPVVDLFAVMRIRMEVVPNSETIRGFVMREDLPYEIDPVERTVTVDAKRRSLTSEELAITEDRIFLRSELFGPLFGLDCAFDLRALEVRFVRNNDIPALRTKLRSIQRPEAMLNNDPALVPVDREITRSPAIGNLGALDWGMTASTTRDGVVSRSLSFDVGGELAGGSVASSLLLSDAGAMTWRSATVAWHRVLDLHPILPRQIHLGSLGRTPSGPLLGARLTNRATEGRRAFGTYVISDRTEPEWIVELYLNYQLVDLVRTDETGEYRFEIPLWYGTTRATLKFYGPYGEERTRLRTIIIPYTFLPAGDVEYTGSAGMILEGTSSTRAAEANLAFGLTSWFSVGAGLEWEDRGMGRDLAQLYSAALRIGDNILCEGSFSPDNSADGTLSMLLPFRSSLDLVWRADFSSLIDQKEVRADLDVPIPALLGSLSLSGSHRSIGPVLYRRGGAALNGSVAGLPLSMSTTLEWSGAGEVELASARGRFAASLSLPLGTMLRPILEFDWREGKAMSATIEGNVAIANGTALHGSITRVQATGLVIGAFGLRLDLPFLHASSNGVGSAGGTVTRTSASGSIWMDAAEGTTLVRGSGSTGRGGLTIRPYLDIDNDGERDGDEPLLPNTSLSINGGIVTGSWGDSLIRIIDLQPFVPYLLTVSEIGFENLNWRPRYATWRVRTLPNVFETIDIPIIITGEVEGMVVKGVDAEERGLSGMRVFFRGSDGEIVASVLTEQGGGFLYIGLPPGEYTAELDGDQLAGLRLRCDTPLVPVTIRATPEGDLVEGLVFRVQR